VGSFMFIRDRVRVTEVVNDSATPQP
jgi:hypothetical protein